MFAFEDDNWKWTSLLANLLTWSILPALIAALASTEKRAHPNNRLVNECLVAAQFGLIGFYSTLLVAAELRERDKNQVFALIGLSLLFAITGLFLTRSMDRRIQAAQPHDCSLDCGTLLSFRAKFAAYGANVIICCLSLALACCVTFSPMVVKAPVKKASTSAGTYSSHIS